MPRQPRRNIGDGTFHVMWRGNRRQPIVYDREDCMNLRRLITMATSRFGLECEAVCLLSNHLHLRITARQRDLTDAMHWMGTCHAITFNRRHGVDGHLFQGRFKAKLITDVQHYQDNAVYIALNPVEAGLCRHPVLWADSTYAATIGRAKLPPFLSLAWLERAFECSLPAAVRAFEQLVEEELRAYTQFAFGGTDPGQSL